MNTLTSRSEAQAVSCTRCHAAPGEKCQGKRGPREACHLERHHLAEVRRRLA